MSRKVLIEALRAYGKDSLSGRELETCYTADLMIALREENNRNESEGIRRRSQYPH